mmetsp:Transcript_59641/g.130955  ORF Transcript_59641/g.130955 Transcript_59641/m.130955 type:complete len:773 (-) Transcript_59641:17-2335(-)
MAASVGCLVAVGLCLLLAPTATAGLSSRSFTARLNELGASAKDTPVQRVIKLLQEMKGQLEKEVTADAGAYDKMVCWCETNDKAKSKAITEADARITELLSEVEARSGRDGELATKIEHLKAEIVAQKEALAGATALREKELAEFNSEENDMTQAVTMLKNAILVLSRHNAGLLQLTPALESSVGSALRWAALKHEEMLELGAEGSRATRQSPLALLAAGRSARREARVVGGGAAARLLALLGPREMAASAELPAKYASRVLAAAATQGASFAQQQRQPAHLQAYVPQSGEIFGLLRQMQEEFEASLSSSQKRELQAREDFAELKTASERQLTAATAALDSLEADYGTNAQALSNAKEDLSSTRETRSADNKFLSDLRLKCQDLDHQWKQRSAARSEEVKAVAGAIAILTEDDARDLFQKKLGTGGGESSFLQLGAATSGERRHLARSRAAAVLMHAAKGLGGGSDAVAAAPAWWRVADGTAPHKQLAVMAVQVQLDAFAKVKKAIDDMVAELKSQQEEEVKHKALCTKELGQNEKQTYATGQVKADLEDRIGALEETIQKLSEDITAATAEIASTEVEVKQASETREKENQVFQEEVTDQRAMQQILKKAAARLRVAYKKKALLQAGPEPPVHFQPYKQNAGAVPVVSMIEAIIQDSEATEKDAVSGEQTAQQAYEVFVNDSNALIKRLEEAIEKKTRAKAGAGVEKEEAEAQLKSTTGRLEDLAAYAADLHMQCDFMLKNFDIRQASRLQEIEALQGAKSYLSGMNDDDA